MFIHVLFLSFIRDFARILPGFSPGIPSSIFLSDLWVVLPEFLRRCLQGFRHTIFNRSLRFQDSFRKSLEDFSGDCIKDFYQDSFLDYVDFFFEFPFGIYFGGPPDIPVPRFIYEFLLDISRDSFNGFSYDFSEDFSRNFLRNFPEFPSRIFPGIPSLISSKILLWNYSCILSWDSFLDAFIDPSRFSLEISPKIPLRISPSNSFWNFISNSLRYSFRDFFSEIPSGIL